MSKGHFWKIFICYIQAETPPFAICQVNKNATQNDFDGQDYGKLQE
jgi:hypothetical protein